MQTVSLTAVFDLEAGWLDTLLRAHPLVGPLFSRNFTGLDDGVLRETYLALLKMHADQVRYSAPALRAAAELLRAGDAEDRRWSEFMAEYAAGETDPETGCGREVRAQADMRALAAPETMVTAPAHPAAVHYGCYFVDSAGQHPYAILGARGVLGHLAVMVSDEIAEGVLDSGIHGGDRATGFLDEYGTLDLARVRRGDADLARLTSPGKRRQVLEGAYVASGVYRSLVHQALPAG